MNIKSNIIKQEGKDLILSVAGMFIFAASIAFFSVRNGLPSGGMVGFAIVLAPILKISVGALLFAINTVLIIIAFATRAKRTGIHAIIGYSLFSIVLDLAIQNIAPNPQAISLYPAIINTALAGIVAPIGVIVILRANYSLGNYSTIYAIIKPKLNISAGILLLTLDILVAGLILFIRGPYYSVLILLNASVFTIAYELYERILHQIISASRD